MSRELLKKKGLNFIDYKKLNLSYNNLSELILTNLANVGYVIIKNFNIDPLDIIDSTNKFTEISSLIGKCIGHDKDGKIVWDIKSNPSSNSLIKTYSEHSHNADLHTDSQYSSYPEDYFGLLTLKKAECGGGISSLLSLKNILKSLKSIENYEEIENVLSKTKYPFIVPNVFKKEKNTTPEFNYGPILLENEIRFRVDTFEKALIHKEAKCSEKQIEAYKILKKIILENEEIEKFYLEERDLIFINNKTMLHGRSEFMDKERHLLRIRMNKLNYKE